MASGYENRQRQVRHETQDHLLRPEDGRRPRMVSNPCEGVASKRKRRPPKRASGAAVWRNPSRTLPGRSTKISCQFSMKASDRGTSPRSSHSTASVCAQDPANPKPRVFGRFGDMPTAVVGHAGILPHPDNNPAPLPGRKTLRASAQRKSGPRRIARSGGTEPAGCLVSAEARLVAYLEASSPIHL